MTKRERKAQSAWARRGPAERALVACLVAAAGGTAAPGVAIDLRSPEACVDGAVEVLPGTRDRPWAAAMPRAGPGPERDAPALAAAAADCGPTVHPRAEDPEVIRQVQKIHDNMGHPDNRTLVRVLKYGRAKPEYVEAASRLTCSACQAARRPTKQRPAKAPTTYEFNATVGLDLFFLEGPAPGTKVPVMNLVCHGTGFQLAVPIASRAGTQLRRAYREEWVRHYGAPKRLIVDGERGLALGEFARLAETDGTELAVTSAKSPWQAGKTERLGGVWKETFYRARQSLAINTWEDWHEAVDAVNVATGQCTRRGGASAYQRVFGRPPRLPEELLGERELDPLTVETAQDPDAELTRSIIARRTAVLAYIEADAAERWRRALNRRGTPARGPFTLGDRVMVWRLMNEKGAVDKSWHGPARVIQVGRGTVWCSWRGSVLKCSPEHVRHLTQNENDAENLIPVDLRDLGDKDCELRGRQHLYEDLAGQGGPDEPAAAAAVSPAAPAAVAPEDPAAEARPEPGADRRGGAWRPEEDPTQMHERLEAEEREARKRFLLDDVPLGVRQALRRAELEGPAAPRQAPGSQPGPGGTGRERRTKRRRRRAALAATASGDVPAMYVSPNTPKKRKELSEKAIGGQRAAPFRAAKLVEWQALFNSKALRLVSPGEAQQVRDDPARGSRVLRSRWTLTLKDGIPPPPPPAKGGARPAQVPLETQRLFCEEGVWLKAKARWIVLGHTDPDLAQIDTYSPTLSRDGQMLVLQLLATFGWQLQVADITSAFAAGKPLERSEPLYCELPPTGAPGAPSGGMVELLKAVYGLGDGPLKWFESFVSYALELGLRQSSFDPCLLYWRLQDGRLGGVIGVTVDDLLTGGVPEFEEKLAALRKRFPFGSWKKVEATYCGKLLRQRPDGAIRISQEAAAGCIPEVLIGRGRRQDPGALVTAEERHGARSALGSLAYVARESRPDLSGPTALLQGRVEILTVKDLLEINKLVRLCHATKDTEVIIQPIPIDRLALVAFGDASWANARDGASQAGWLLVCADKGILEHGMAPISPVAWKSHKLKRKVAHQFAAEVLAVSEAMAAAEYWRTAWLELVCAEFQLQRPYALAGRLPVATVTDSKGGYDHLNNPAPGSSSDLRSAIDVAIVRDALKRPAMVLRWVEGTQQLTDPLTKLAGEGDLLRAALRCGEHAILEESKTLERRLAERQRRADARPGAPALAAAVCSHGPAAEADVAGEDTAEAEVRAEDTEDEADDEDYEPTSAKKLRPAVSLDNRFQRGKVEPV